MYENSSKYPNFTWYLPAKCFPNFGDRMQMPHCPPSPMSMFFYSSQHSHSLLPVLCIDVCSVQFSTTVLTAKAIANARWRVIAISKPYSKMTAWARKWRGSVSSSCCKGAITSKIKYAIKHTIKLKTSPARFAQLLQPSLAFCFSLQPMTAHSRHWLQAFAKTRC